jgi:alkylated DNA repair dioxygenase AlkB
MIGGNVQNGDEQKKESPKRKRDSKQQQLMDKYTNKKQKIDKKTTKLDEKGSIIHYSPNFIEKKESKALFDHLLDNIPWKESTIQMFGKELKVPRLQCVMSDHENSKLSLYSKEEPQPWSKEILQLKDKIETELNEKFDYVLIN